MFAIVAILVQKKKKPLFSPLTSAPFATHRPPLILTKSKTIIELHLNGKELYE